MQNHGSVLRNIRENYDSLFAAEKKVADFILENSTRAVSLNVSELAELAGASDATVIRLCKHLGYSGFYSMKLQLSHDLGRDTLLEGSLHKGPPEVSERFALQAKTLLDASDKLDTAALDKSVALLWACDAVHIISTGNSLPVALDLNNRLSYIGIRSLALFQRESQLNTIALAKDNDLVFGISHSGSSRSVLTAFELARAKKLATISLTDFLPNPLASRADISLSPQLKNTGLAVFGAESNLFFMAFVDALVYRASQQTSYQNHAQRIESLAAENKI